MRVLVVLSNENQVRVVEPVTQQLTCRGDTVHFISLDNFYNQRAEQALTMRNVSWEHLHCSLPKISWWEVTPEERKPLLLQAAISLDEVFIRFTPDIFICANGVGELEQFATRAAERFGVPTLFMQDGLLAPAKAETIKDPVYAGAMPEGGNDVVCVWSKELEKRLLARGCTSKIVVTGAPRYDKIIQIPLRKKSTPPYTAVLATQCFSRYNLELPGMELAMFDRTLHRLLQRSDIGKIVLRPHPQTTMLERYQEMAERHGPRVCYEDSEDSIHIIQEADIVVATSSTILIEAVLSGIPVIELSYLRTKELKSFLKYDLRFEQYLKSETFPDNFFVAEPTAEAFLDTWCLPVDGKATERVLAEVLQLVQKNQQTPAQKLPEISIITELHETEPILPLRSILRERDLAIEVLAVDRSSESEAGNLVSKTIDDPRLKILSLPGASRSQALATILAQAKGKYVVVVDSLTLCRPNALSEIAQMLEQDRDARAVISAAGYYEPSGIVTSFFKLPERMTLEQLMRHERAGLIIRFFGFRRSELSQIPGQLPETEQYAIHLLHNLVQGQSQAPLLAASHKVLYSYPYAPTVSHTRAIEEFSKQKAKCPTAETSVLKISVLLSSYNRASKVAQCLAALAAQTLPVSQFEVVCVNNGSTDETAGLMRAWCDAHNGVYVEQKIKGSRAAAKNSALAAARGELVLFINDDMYASPTLLEAHLHAHQLHQNRDTAVCGHVPFAESYRDNIFSLALTEKNLWFGNKGQQSDRPLLFWHFNTDNLSLPRKLFVERNIDFDEAFTCSGDEIECGYRLWQKGLDIYYHPEAVAVHDHQFTIETCIAREQKNAADIVQFCIKHPDVVLAERLLTVPRLDQTILTEWRNFVDRADSQVSQIIQQLKELEHLKTDLSSDTARTKATMLVKEVAESVQLVTLYIKLRTFLEIFDKNPRQKEILISEDWAQRARSAAQRLNYQGYVQ